MRLVLESFAKLNLFLEVLGRREDGYHELSTVMQTVDLADEVVVEEGDGVRVECDDPDVPGGEGNIAHRAALLLREEMRVREGCRILIRKRIPVEAGLGGGSGNAAAALAGLARLWRLDVSQGRLAEIGARIGSDVPFFLYGGTRLCSGRGEVVRPFAPIPASTRFLVVTPAVRLPTSFVYKEFATKALTSGRPSSNLKPAPESDPESGLPGLFNRLEDAVLPAFPSVRETKGRMERVCPAGVRMSGSGPTLFGLLPPAGVEDGALLDRFRDCRFAALARPTSCGYRFLPPLRTGQSTEGGGRNGN